MVCGYVMKFGHVPRESLLDSYLDNCANGYKEILPGHEYHMISTHSFFKRFG